jgi:hypothetical protein
MGQKRNDAAVMGAQTKSSREECVLSMGQRRNDAAVKDAQTKQLKEESVGDTEQIQTATPMMSLQLLHHTLGQSLRKLQ